MIDLADVKIVHVEASSRCNSHCPMCSRYTGLGHIQPGLVEEDLQPDVFYKLFTAEFTAQLDHVYFSGVYGDPCLNKLLPEYVNYLISHGCKSISIDTNGGYRDESWWAQLAIPKVLINFALDGASNETLGQYRIGVVYDKVIKNLTSFVNAGGRAQWNFIVFKHNEHEVEQARSLAKELNVDFRIKVTQKFRNKKDFKIMKQGQQIGVLEPPAQEQYRHNNIGTDSHVPHSQFEFNLAGFTSLNNNKIVCKSQERSEIFLAASGLLLPCCYLGTYTHDSPGAYQFTKEFNMADFDLHLGSVADIIEKMKEISRRWNLLIEQGNLITCLHTCGNKENTTLYHNDKLSKENILKQK